MTDDQNFQSAKHAVDAVAAVGIVFSWSILPAILAAVASSLGIVWYCAQLYDWIIKKRNARRQKRRREDKNA